MTNSTSQEDEEFSFANALTIDTPDVNDTGSVQRMGDPSPANPYICHVSGVADYSTDYSLSGIKVLAVKSDIASAAAGTTAASGGEPYASVEEEVSAVEAGGIDVDPNNIDPNTGEWFTSFVIGNIDRDPDVTWNHISAVALVDQLNPNAPPLTPGQRLAHHQFKAAPVPVGGCPTSALVAIEAAKQISKPRAAVAPIMLQPLDVTDGWIRY